MPYTAEQRLAWNNSDRGRSAKERYEASERARRTREAYWGSVPGIKARLRAVHTKRERAIHGTRTP